MPVRVRQLDRLPVAPGPKTAISAPGGWSKGKAACASRSPNALAASRIEALLRGAWRLASSNEGRSHASLKGHTPLTVADGPMVARAELNTVRSVSHCRALV